ncbi:hypothetical protein [Labrys neptuniae]
MRDKEVPRFSHALSRGFGKSLFGKFSGTASVTACLSFARRTVLQEEVIFGARVTATRD